MAQVEFKLGRYERSVVCSAITDAQIRLDKERERITEKRRAGKTYQYVVGEGRENLNKLWESNMRKADALHSAGTTMGCYGRT